MAVLPDFLVWMVDWNHNYYRHFSEITNKQRKKPTVFVHVGIYNAGNIIWRWTSFQSNRTILLVVTFPCLYKVSIIVTFVVWTDSITGVTAQSWNITDANHIKTNRKSRHYCIHEFKRVHLMTSTFYFKGSEIIWKRAFLRHYGHLIIHLFWRNLKLFYKDLVHFKILHTIFKYNNSKHLSHHAISWYQSWL